MSETKSLLTAILAVQKEAPTLPKDAKNPHFGSSYTPLDTIVETMMPILNKHGLIWNAFPCSDEHGQPALRYQLVHAETAEAMEGVMPLLLTKQDSQGMGSAITYARRYCILAVLNLVGDDDDDGNAASQPRAAGSGSSMPQAPTGPQLKYLRTLVTQSRAPKRTLEQMLKQVGASHIDVKEGWAGQLNREQASAMIEIFKGGVLPDPDAQDIPADQPELPVSEEEETSDLPWDQDDD